MPRDFQKAKDAIEVALMNVEKTALLAKNRRLRTVEVLNLTASVQVMRNELRTIPDKVGWRDLLGGTKS